MHERDEILNEILQFLNIVRISLFFWKIFITWLFPFKPFTHTHTQTVPKWIYFRFINVCYIKPTKKRENMFERYYFQIFHLIFTSLANFVLLSRSCLFINDGVPMVRIINAVFVSVLE